MTVCVPRAACCVWLYVCVPRAVAARRADSVRYGSSFCAASLRLCVYVCVYVYMYMNMYVFVYMSVVQAACPHAVMAVGCLGPALALTSPSLALLRAQESPPVMLFGEAYCRQVRAAEGQSAVTGMQRRCRGAAGPRRGKMGTSSPARRARRRRPARRDRGRHEGRSVCCNAASDIPVNPCLLNPFVCIDLILAHQVDYPYHVAAFPPRHASTMTMRLASPTRRCDGAGVMESVRGCEKCDGAGVTGSGSEGLGQAVWHCALP
jgi:hypothetical protein